MQLTLPKADTGTDWRLKKFLEYTKDDLEELSYLNLAYLNNLQATNDQKVWWVFLFSTCYCAPTATAMFHKLNYTTLTNKEIDSFWNVEKTRLLFQTDRRYIKTMNQFPVIVKEFLERSNRKPWEYINKFVRETPEETCNSLYKEVSSWKYYGRFATVLFIRTLINIFPDLDIKPSKYDWRRGSTTTTAVYLINYDDRKAKDFEDDKYKLSSKDIDRLNEDYEVIERALNHASIKRKWNIFNTSFYLCGFRKLFKATRYVGYYIDRHQEDLLKLEESYPEFNKEWNKMWGLRRELIDNRYLGEVNGWVGIRKHNLHNFLQTGLVEVPLD